MTIGGSRTALGQGPPLTDEETAMICCATGYTVTPSLTRNCVSVSGSTKVTAVAVQIRWRARDLVILETDPLTAGVKMGSTIGSTVSSTSRHVISTSTTSSSSSTSTAATPSPPSEKQGMGIGAKAGIGAGIGLAVIFLLTSLLFYLRGRPRRSRETIQTRSGVELGDTGFSIAQLPAAEIVDPSPVHNEPLEMAVPDPDVVEAEAVQVSASNAIPATGRGESGVSNRDAADVEDTAAPVVGVRAENTAVEKAKDEEEGIT
jgi:hypothetical protein